jgi:excisionase family DNA binding protein
MPKLTTVEAAQLAGVSRSTVWRACKSGRLSAERAGKDFAIEVSELQRVFPLQPPATSHPVTEKPDATGPSVAEKPDETALVAELRRQVERLEADKADLRQERDRLLSLVERQSDQVRLLTDQRERQPWLRRLFRKMMLL